MTEGEIREAFESALGEVDIELPVQIAHCIAIRDALRPKLPAGALIDVFLRHGLVIAARCSGRVVTMIVPLD